ncbi:hypothetical protein HH1059_11990 [Halorhodospira halochloris]|uniref:Uncharacterized protein n=1 Tax=Halorhodospira halochloris TaxID=1052 RepID=A0A2Z6EZI9_HALHR|nr:hypothetical protein [Halorhodospira halochloris]BBE11051.1 hypothetical protein HH1059_11990 [Halorhodospira halochloris]
MMDRIRDTVRDLAEPGGIRRHPVIAGILSLLVALVIVGLIMRPM